MTHRISHPIESLRRPTDSQQNRTCSTQILIADKIRQNFVCLFAFMIATECLRIVMIGQQQPNTIFIITCRYYSPNKFKCCVIPLRASSLMMRARCTSLLFFLIVLFFTRFFSLFYVFILFAVVACGQQICVFAEMVRQNTCIVSDVLAKSIVLQMHSTAEWN